MRKIMKCLVGGMLVAGFTVGSVGVASADSPNTGCRDGWSLANAVSDDAVARDRNDDGKVCGKSVNGTGNGDYLQPNFVVTDNNTPPAAG